MTAVISQFLGVLGVDVVTPATMAELIPWLVQLAVGIAVLSWILNTFKYWIASIFGGRLM